jgi:WD40 repeat protein
VIDRIGQQLGNYRLLRLIGQGGFADVYLGEHIHLGTQAAVKVLHTQVANNDIEAFRFEARTIAQLEHPNIIRVFEFDIEDGTPFLIMSYAPNGNLRQRHIKGVSLSTATIVFYVKQIAEALQYAHDQKIIHRDIKPENMLLGRRNEVLLSDFGIALIAQSTSSQSKQDVIGTIHYMAPEQIRGKSRPASDQYALGVIVYEWVCGYRPFYGSFTEIATQHMFEPPAPLREKNPNITPDIERVVMTALAKEPQQRFANIQAFATSLEQACSSPAPHAPMASQSAPGAPPDQLQPSVVVTIPPTKHSWPTMATPPSNQSPHLGTTPIPPASLRLMPLLASQPPTRQISRRTVVAGVVGLGLVGIGTTGIIWFTRSKPSAAPIAKPTIVPTQPSVGTTFYTYHGHANKIRVLAWSPDGKRIASGSDDYTAHVWDAATGNNPLIYHGHTSFVEGLAWSPDSKRIASGCADTTVQIWNPSDGSLIYSYRGHSLWVNRVSWSYDGTYIASGEQSSIGGQSVQVRVWEASTGKTVAVYHGHSNGVFAVAWSPDSTRVASCGYDGTLQIWEGATGKPIVTYRDNTANFGLAWSPDSQRIAVACADTLVRVVDAKTGNSIYTYSGHTQYVGDVAWSPDGKHIASGSADQTVQVFDATTGLHLYTYTSQSGHLDAVVWSPNNKRIASGSDSGAVQVWQAP